MQIDQSGKIQLSGPVGEDPLEEEMATRSSILAWKISGERSLAGYGPCGRRVRHNLATECARARARARTHTHTHTHTQHERTPARARADTHTHTHTHTHTQSMCAPQLFSFPPPVLRLPCRPHSAQPFLPGKVKQSSATPWFSARRGGRPCRIQ